MEKKSVSVGPVDVIVILAALCVVAFIFFYFLTSNEAPLSSGTTDILFTVELERKGDGFQSDVKVGDPLYDSVKGLYMGEIVSVEVQPYTASAQDKINGVYVLSEVDGMVSIYVTAKIAADISDRETTVNGVDLAVGKEMFIRSETFASRGFGVRYEVLE